MQELPEARPCLPIQTSPLSPSLPAGVSLAWELGPGVGSPPQGWPCPSLLKASAASTILQPNGGQTWPEPGWPKLGLTKDALPVLGLPLSPSAQAQGHLSQIFLVCGNRKPKVHIAMNETFVGGDRA